ncbi:hypothetical protein [Actinotalea sp. K2]|uniref:hypothetical protein n=1 Tax=Actinotalea sp. K2 TaxID=2939438 RepID=UPI0020181E36|nr:hypothetical protein [Actinotalea sp. K2]MCL3859434.1 hypothetical protein [Actinotalea sp. K2]
MLDRRAVVGRHAVRVTGIDPASPLQVGNGELCLAVDPTGLQTFPDQYPVTDPGGGAPGTLLGTQSQWGWHSTPRPDGADLAATRRPYRSARGEVLYVDAPPLSGSDDTALDVSHRWLRANPHRLDLVRIALVVRDAPPGRRDADDEGGGAQPGSGPGAYRPPSPSELGESTQVLDLWTGVVVSDLVLAGRRLRVTTACHPDRDVLAVRVERLDLAPDDERTSDLAVRLTFPYGSESWSNAADWSRPDRHRTDLTPTQDGALVHRHFDGAVEPTWTARLVASPGARLERSGAHELLMVPAGPVLDLAVGLGPGAQPPAATGVDVVVQASSAHWPTFWGRGAAIDLAGSTDPRAPELERRVVLSQYLTAIQCAGSTPPQETGLLCNSWRGRFHLEMHWWHAAHFALWGRPDLLERSMAWYLEALPAARRTARTQGYDGARWPKQVGPDARESPSDIGPFLLWQQPHVIHLAELLRRAGSPGAVERYAEVVDATARFMADVAQPRQDGYGLGPPLVPAQESYASIRDRATDPPFELAAWSWALEVAQQWRVRAGTAREPQWDAVGHAMVKPLVRDGRYEAIGVEPFTIRTDHPSMVYGLGVIPPTEVMDPEVVRATLHGVLEDWDWESTWGWDYPALAMTATRLGEPATAVDVLLLEVTKNQYLPNGHNRQTDHLPVYLPGNGGLLAAVALMAGGWKGGPVTPGFGEGWRVRHEGFVPAPARVHGTTTSTRTGTTTSTTHEAKEPR